MVIHTTFNKMSKKQYNAWGFDDSQEDEKR